MCGKCLRCRMNSLMLSDDGLCLYCASLVSKILVLLIKLGKEGKA